jgi:hypothetical protein
VLSHLRGDGFSKGLDVGFEWDEQDALLRSRLDWLAQLCADRDVIHVGCVDHSAEVVERKRRQGRWLHGRLCESARRCFGIDLDSTGIEYLRKLGYEDVAAIDLLADDCAAIRARRWDQLLLGEVLEHLDDPVGFLAALREKFSACVQTLVITVPNAFAQRNHERARAGIEKINTDHRFWFTPYTLAKVVIRAGLTPDRFVLCESGTIEPRKRLRNLRLRRRPLLRNDIILLAQMSGSASVGAGSASPSAAR